MNMQEMTVKDFCALTASDSPAPGGGSIAALCGALAAALSEMVANLSIGKKSVTEPAETFTEAAGELQALRAELLEAIDKDAESFNAFMAAIGMPKSTDEEKAARRAAMQNALKGASLVPMSVARTAAKVLPFAEAMLDKGNQNALTDAMVSAMSARTAVLGALLNVKINLMSIKDETFVSEMNTEIASLREFTLETEARILEKGSAKL